MERPSHPFSPQDPSWQRYVYHLARWQLLQIRDIAGACGVKLNTFKSYDDILSVMRTGWAEARGFITGELMSIASIDPYVTDDPNERAQLRMQKLDALKTLNKTCEKRDEMQLFSEDKEKDRDALKELTTEELKAKARELLK